MRSLSIENFRTFTAASYDPAPKLNVLVGPNGAGKTNLLEAIHTCLIGRSHRAAPDGEMLAAGRGHWRVNGAVETGDAIHNVSVAFTLPGSRRIRLDGAPVRAREFVGCFPVVSIGPDDVMLAAGGPGVRRRFLDLHLSQTDAVYLGDLIAYRRALAQRNHALRDPSGRGGDPAQWDPVLASVGGRIVSARARFVSRIAEEAELLHRAVSGGGERLSIRYASNLPEQPGANATETILLALKSSRERDAVLGSTSVGPHRDDLTIEVDGRDARAFASQGQRWCATLAILFAARSQLRRSLQAQPVLLLDDVFAQLDRGRSDRLAGIVSGSGQVFIATPRESDVRSEWGAPVFRVSPGVVEAAR